MRVVPAIYLQFRVWRWYPASRRSVHLSYN